MKLNRTHYIGFAVFLVIVFLILPVKFHYSFRTIGKIIPEKVWILQKTNDGSLMATLTDNKNGLVQNYSIIQVERGDATRFQLSPTLNEKEYVSEHDTIGSIHSYEVLRQLIQLEGELVVAKATLRTQLVGEKEAIIQEARQQLVLAREKAELQRRLFLRQDSLFLHNLVSQEEYELVQSEAKIAEIEVNIAEVQLQTVTTGVKPEQIEMIEAEIRSLENDIRIRKNQMEAFNLQTPIAGKLYRSFSSDTLLSVCDTSYVLVIPVKWQYHAELSPGRSVFLKSAEGSTRLSAKILRIEDNIKILNREQVFMAVALIEGDQEFLYPNLIVPCTVQGRSLSPLHYVIRLVQSMFGM